VFIIYINVYRREIGRLFIKGEGRLVRNLR